MVRILTRVSRGTFGNEDFLCDVRNMICNDNETPTHATPTLLIRNYKYGTIPHRLHHDNPHKQPFYSFETAYKTYTLTGLLFSHTLAAHHYERHHMRDTEQCNMKNAFSKLLQ